MRNPRNLLKLPENEVLEVEEVLDPSTERRAIKHNFLAGRNINTTLRETKTLAEAILPQVLA